MSGVVLAGSKDRKGHAFWHLIEREDGNWEIAYYEFNGEYEGRAPGYICTKIELLGKGVMFGNPEAFRAGFAAGEAAMQAKIMKALNG